MRAAVVVAGAVAEVVAWWFVAFRGRSIWGLMSPLFVALGVSVVLIDPPPLSGERGLAVAAVVGIGSGIGLYLATRLFVFAVRPWATFRRHAAAMYLRQRGVRPVAAVALSAGVIALGEELFWRGLAQPRLAAAAGSGAFGAVLAWGTYVLANLASANLAVLAGAIVGGAAWTLLAWWTGGVAASIACHAVWTSLMVALPVVPVGSGARG